MVHSKSKELPNYQFNENNITDIHEVEQRLNIQVAASIPSLYFYSWSS